jgi:prepilin-type N-terminal cleavage/methylation domain-containing protein
MRRFLTPQPPRRALGFTLIEVVVVMALTAMLLVLSVAFGMQWANSAAVSTGQGVVEHAYSMAKATALANPGASTGTAAASIVCFTTTQVSVYAGGACSGSAVWSGALPSGVAVLFGSPTPSATANCIALSDAATVVVPASSGCTASSQYAVSKGDASATNTLF